MLKLLLFTILTGCLDPKTTKIQYVPDMADAPRLKPQLNYIDPPEFSIAMNRPLYPSTAEIAENVLQNVTPDTDATVEQGKKWFNVYCTPCHGVDGKGVGSITDVYMPAPNLTEAAYRARKDGFFFHRITFGAQAIMPGYGHATTALERWQIVRYLRVLQKKG